ncbi:peptidylprolyl isomerase [Candidatus Pandoraea novymonadis]|uniref:Chaperone SurA n=1 Tax=Candidatus Pandoraea novymonadis TaxID=1808959 RepID=A0ABX5FFA4_9BURK|nr:peptidylprolyl isomerase [Candidatus Pandoraea novymonadis]PSB91712.1 Chaperone SurA [Candidatus Pandoraea novymonadis]
MNDFIVIRLSLLAILCLGANLALAQPASTSTKILSLEKKTVLSVEPLDSIIALVNDNVITKQELDQRVSEILRELKQQKRTTPASNLLQHQILKEMVITLLQLEAAKERGIAVSDEDVEHSVQRAATNNHMSINQYRSHLQSHGIQWPVFRQRMRDQITIDRLRSNEIDSQVQVSEFEINTFLAAQRGAPTIPSEPEYRLAQILVKVPNIATDEEVNIAKKKAEKIFLKAKSGANFKKLAQKYSESSNAVNGGDMGYRIPERIPDFFLTEVSKLRIGEVVPKILRSSNGFYILKLLATRQQQPVQNTMTVPQIHARHILIRTGNGIHHEQQARQKLLKVKAQLQKGQVEFSNVGNRLYADGFAAQSDDLGWLSPGEAMPAFEQALSKLKDGQISDPVMSEYGYHLIQVIGHREGQISVDKERNLATHLLRVRKAEQHYLDWLQQLYNTAYVEYRI